MAVFKISFANLLQYRWDFILGQIRWLIFLITMFFLWSKLFPEGVELFNFTRNGIISYLFIAAVLRQFVTTSATDQIASELQAWGKFFSYLLKPIGYFRYWFSVDLVYKVTNLFSLLVIVIFLSAILNVELIFTKDILYIVLFLLSAATGLLTYFFISILISTTAFWTTQVWGLQFLMVLVIDFASGAFFPINVLPHPVQTILNLTPFPYLLYWPTLILLGKLTPEKIVFIIFVSATWMIASFLATTLIWRKGLKTYEAWGG